MKKILWLFISLFLSFILISCSSKGKIELVYSNYSEGFKAYNMLQVGFEYSEKINNPYDTDEIIVDAYIVHNNIEEVVPMFYYEEYVRHLEGDIEVLDKTNINYLALRYTPLEAGNYTIYAEFKQGSNSYKSKSVNYSIIPGMKDGNLKVSSDKKHLEFSNGSPFVGIGHNLCGWEWGGVDNSEGTYEYDKWFVKLKDSGANMVQFDLCEGDNIEWTKRESDLPYSSDYNGLNYYNQQACFKNDYKVKLATDLGLYFRFSFYHWEDFDNEAGNFPDWGWEKNPYNTKNGGVVDNVSDFFTNEKAKKATKDYLRYSVARWGYSTSILAYELWNEVDSPDMVWGEGKNYLNQESNITKWHDEMAKYLHSLDKNHLVTTSFAQTFYGGPIWELDSIDITTFHRYTMYNSDYEGVYQSGIVLYNVIDSRNKMYEKPVLGGEFALSPGGDVQRQYDHEYGIGMHNQLWASIFSNSIGTAMHWTWGSYIDRYNLYYHYEGLSKFIKYEDLRGLTLDTNVRNSENATYYVLSNEDKALIWVKNVEYEYYNVMIAQKEVSEISGYKVPLKNLANGIYVVESYDTISGELLNKKEIEISSSNNELLIDDFKNDIAIKVIKKENVYETINLGAGGSLDKGIVSGNSISLYSKGVDLAGLSDDGLFTYLEVTGDFIYTARVDKNTYSGENSKAGIMVRNTLGNSSKMVFVALNGLGEYNVFKRYSSVPEALGWNKIGMGSYLRIERTGNIFKAFVSSDGINYILVEEIEFSKFNQTCYVGVAACAINQIAYNDAFFTNVKLERK